MKSRLSVIASLSTALSFAYLFTIHLTVPDIIWDSVPMSLLIFGYPVLVGIILLGFSLKHKDNKSIFLSITHIFSPIIVGLIYAAIFNISPLVF
ncbi:hypothetical protein HCQ94_04580 [Actinomyces sp. zg-332]|uniref:hypothetical protein n=1 Tax=Actinomyces sp. zg-332 TaxID=2708340 RepID=UPI0014221DE8|nr:hypothetical protein [Actinomyces sp. zg-332]QPK93865.1 hypothetical protein HCQ94_04580 [Actinomyces sp. zg-332]